MATYDLTGRNTVSLPTDYQSFIHVSRYARWINEENRRDHAKREEKLRTVTVRQCKGWQAKTM